MYKYAPILLELSFNKRDSNHEVLQYVFFLGVIQLYLVSFECLL